MAISYPNIGFIILTILAWAGIHGKLQEKDIELFQSRIWMSELPPAVIFSFSVIYYLIPTGYQLITGNLPEYVTIGPFFPIMQFVGAVIFTVASVSWVSLLSDEKEEIENMKADFNKILGDLEANELEINFDELNSNGFESTNTSDEEGENPKSQTNSEADDSETKAIEAN